MANNSQYTIPQTFLNQNQEAQLAEDLSVRLQAQHAQQLAAFSSRLDAQQQQYVQRVDTYATEPHQQPIVSQPRYIERPEQKAFHAPYYDIKETENKLIDVRKVQLAIEEKKHPWLRAAKSLILAPKTRKAMEAVLIDKEFITGGKIVTELYARQGMQTNVKYRFGFTDDKWILYPETNDGTSAENSVSYEFNDDEMKKFFRGHRVPLAPGEDATMQYLIPRYYARNVEENYPVEAAITDLMSPEQANVDSIKRNDLDLAA